MKESNLDRYKKRMQVGGSLGAIVGGATGGLRGMGLGALKAAGLAGGATAVGDLVMGPPEEESNFGNEGVRGAVGGGLLGAGLGFVAKGREKHGMALVNKLMQSGMSKKKALAFLMGGATLGGALGSGATQGLFQGLVLGKKREGED